MFGFLKTLLYGLVNVVQPCKLIPGIFLMIRCFFFSTPPQATPHQSVFVFIFFLCFLDSSRCYNLDPLPSQEAFPIYFYFRLSLLSFFFQYPPPLFFPFPSAHIYKPTNKPTPLSYLPITTILSILPIPCTCPTYLRKDLHPVSCSVFLPMKRPS